MKPGILFTSESVSEGHPDKVADQISDAVVDYVLTHDPMGRVACETLIGPGYVVVAGEVGSTAIGPERLETDIPPLVRATLRRIGYTDEASGFDVANARIDLRLGVQSSEIANKVMTADGAVGAGDQGLMFGYATNETTERLPLPLALAHRLMVRQAKVRRSGQIRGLGPDAKSQVTVRYVDRKPVAIDTVVLATQHTADWTLDALRREVLEHIVAPCVEPLSPLSDVRILINHSGPFSKGGPAADTGLTGRKIIVDTYGGRCSHGGGAFSGKDATKVDRSAAYAARWIACHVIDAGLAQEATIQLAYAIGGLAPVSIFVDTHGTGSVPDEQLKVAIEDTFDLSPKGIIRDLDLQRPIFAQTAAYGHFGRQLEGMNWEQTPRVQSLLASVG